MNVKQVVKKRVDRIQRLADEIGAEVYFPVTGGGISVHLPNAEDKRKRTTSFQRFAELRLFYDERNGQIFRSLALSSSTNPTKNVG